MFASNTEILSFFSKVTLAPMPSQTLSHFDSSMNKLFVLLYLFSPGIVKVRIVYELKNGIFNHALYEFQFSDLDVSRA